jgi:hypothetical protein
MEPMSREELSELIRLGGVVLDNSARVLAESHLALWDEVDELRRRAGGLVELANRVRAEFLATRG